MTWHVPLYPARQTHSSTLNDLTVIWLTPSPMSHTPHYIGSHILCGDMYDSCSFLTAQCPSSYLVSSGRSAFALFSVVVLWSILTGMVKSVEKVGSFSLSTLTLSTGAPTGCVLSLPLHSLFTHGFVVPYRSNTIVRFVADCVGVSLSSCVKLWRRGCNNGSWPLTCS